VTEPARRDWHVGRWGPLGWLETALKGAGIVVGVAALVTALGRAADAAGGIRLAQVVLLAVLSAGLLAAVADRLLEREVVGMAFIPLMLAGHVCMTVALARDGDLGGHVVAFGALMLAGDLVKLAFLATRDFRVRDLPRAVPIALTGSYAVGYAALLVMQAAA
jgi:hypothetical protein